jgi:hypothetical protein
MVDETTEQVLIVYSTHMPTQEDLGPCKGDHRSNRTSSAIRSYPRRCLARSFLVGLIRREPAVLGHTPAAGPTSEVGPSFGRISEKMAPT